MLRVGRSWGASVVAAALLAAGCGSGGDERLIGDAELTSATSATSALSTTSTTTERSTTTTVRRSTTSTSTEVPRSTSTEVSRDVTASGRSSPTAAATLPALDPIGLAPISDTTTTAAPTTTLAPPPPLPPPPPPEPVAFSGTPTIEIPSIGVSVAMHEGIEMSTLDNGPGHWPGTAQPGEQGNVVVAGHRVSNNADFRHLDALSSGDEVIFTTGAGRFSYRVVGVEIVPPDAMWIIEQGGGHTATLFACHPPGSTRERIVAHLVLA